jgi:CDP-diacylglycerol--glycerol-3-phosphate 3-phosphatidyltransferase
MTSARNLTVPNVITVARIATIPVIIWLLTTGDIGMRVVAVIIFAVAAGTDWVDGFIARRFNQVSPLGRMLDPIADKLLVGLVLIGLAWDGSLSAYDLVPVTAILFREFFISGLREFLGNAKVVLPVSQLAKWKTTIQLVAIIVIFLEGILPNLQLVSDIVLWLAGAITIWTGIQYFAASWPHLAGEE